MWGAVVEKVRARLACSWTHSKRVACVTITAGRRYVQSCGHAGGAALLCVCRVALLQLPKLNASRGDSERGFANKPLHAEPCPTSGSCLARTPYALNTRPCLCDDRQAHRQPWDR